MLLGNRRRCALFAARRRRLLARLGKSLEVMPGEEFRVALREAHAVGAAMVLGDRCVSQ